MVSIWQVRQWGGWWRWVRLSPDGVAPARMVSVSASVNLPLCHKVQKFSSGTGSPGWSRKKGRKTVVLVWWWWLAFGKVRGKNTLASFFQTQCRLDDVNTAVELRDLYFVVEAIQSEVKTAYSILSWMFLFDLVHLAVLQLFVVKVLLQCVSTPKLGVWKILCRLYIFFCFLLMQSTSVMWYCLFVLKCHFDTREHADFIFDAPSVY